MSDVLDIDRMISVIQRRCGSQGVTLTFDPHARTAMTNGRDITIPAIHHPVTEDAMTKLHGFVVHECGHHQRPDAFAICNALDKKTTPEELFALFNIVEDDGMEREVANAYAGDAVALGRQNAVILKEITAKWGKVELDDDLTEEQVAPMSISSLGQLSRLEWDGMSNASRTKFFAGMPSVARNLTTKLVKEGYVERMQATKDPHDCWDLAVDLYRRLFPDSDEDELEETRQQGHSMERNEQGEGEEGEGSKGGEEEGEGGGDKLEEGEGEGEVQQQQGTVVSWKDIVFSEHDEWQPKDGKPGNIGIDWTDYTKGRVALMPQHLINVVDLKQKKHKAEIRNDWYGIGTPESFMSDNRAAATFGNQIRRYIQAKSRTRVSKAQYHGRIDKGSIYKLGMPPIDGGEWNKKIFYNFSPKQELDTCIHILTDWSGSMAGEKMKQAADASGRLVQVFDRILRIPVQLAAFSDAHSQCDIGLIKSFNDKVSPYQVAERFSKFYRFCSANNDADAVMWAYNQIHARPEARKILIVLSDGCPAGQYAGNASQNLLYVAKSIEARGDVDLYGVGIQSDAVVTYYNNSKVLSDPEMINNVLFEVIKQGVK